MPWKHLHHNSEEISMIVLLAMANLIIKVSRFFVRSLPTRAATDCGRLFTIVNCRVWKETVRLLFTFNYLRNGEILKIARTSLRDAIFVVRTNPDRNTTFTFEMVVR